MIVRGKGQTVRARFVLWLFALTALLSACEGAPVARCASATDCAEPDAVCEPLSAAPSPSGGALAPDAKTASGVCRVPGLVIAQPAEGAVVGGEVPLEIRIRAREPERFVGDKVGLFLEGSLDAPVATLTRGDDDSFTGTWEPTVPGEVGLVARLLDGALTSGEPRPLTVDLTPPSISISFDAPTRGPADGTFTPGDPTEGFEEAWRRDEHLTVTVAIDVEAHAGVEDLRTDSVRLTVIGVDGSEEGPSGAALELSEASTCPVDWCGQRTLALSEPTFLAFRDHLRLVARAEDLHGNERVVTRDVPLTRWGWSRSLGGGQASGEVAALPDGSVLVASSDGESSVLERVQPDGELVWAAPLEGATRGPVVVDGTSAWVVRNADEGWLTEVALDDGEPTDRCGPFAGFGPAPPVLLVEEGAPHAVAALFHADGGTLVAAPLGEGECISMAPAGHLLEGGTLAADGAEVAYGYTLAPPPEPPTLPDASEGRLRAFELMEDSWSARWAGPIVGVLASSVRLLSERVLVVDDADDGALRAWTRPPTSGQAEWTRPDVGPGVDGPAVALEGSAYLSSGAGEVLRVDEEGWVVLRADTGVPFLTPTLGMGDRLYAIEGSAELTARDRDLAPLWAVTLGGGQARGPLLGCGSAGGGGGSGGASPASPAPLYLTSGERLYALVVDSPGPDPDAPWGQALRDGGRSGNASRSPWGCP